MGRIRLVQRVTVEGIVPDMVNRVITACDYLWNDWLWEICSALLRGYRGLSD